MIAAPSRPKVAVAIDAESISHACAKQVLDVAAEYGDVVAVQAYGNFLEGTLQSWTTTAPRYGISLKHYAPAVSGKNATDISMSIAVMDLLHTSDHDVFILCTHDCDFVPLVHRIRHAGKKCIGVGHNPTNVAYRNACSEFRCISTNVAAILAAAAKHEEETPLDKLIQVAEQHCSKDGGMSAVELGSIVSAAHVWPHPWFQGRKLTVVLAATGRFRLVGSGVTVRVIANGHQDEAAETADLDKEAAEPVQLLRLAPAKIIGHVDLSAPKEEKAEEPKVATKPLSPWQQVKNEIAVIMSTSPDFTVYLGPLTRKLKKSDPDFSPGKYGYSNIRNLVAKAVPNVTFQGEGIHVTATLDLSKSPPMRRAAG